MVHIANPEPQFHSEFPLQSKPAEFDIQKHGHRYRRQPRPCTTEYILYMLDTSGSIGRDRFMEMTCEVANLVKWFCKPIKIAAMTFGDTFSREMCFDEYDNTCDGRSDAKAEMKSIPYRGGLTHTACALDFTFTNIIEADDCGADLTDGCLTIVVITDGQSNGCGDVCQKVQYYKQLHDFEIYTIGIGNTNQAELECISDNTPEHIFHFSDFQEFTTRLDQINNFFQSTPFNCVDHPSETPRVGIIDHDVDCSLVRDPC